MNSRSDPTAPNHPGTRERRAPRAPIPGAAGPAWPAADAYLFDIDGTLLNVRDGVHYHAFHHAVERVFGICPQIDGIPLHGNTDVGILRAVLRREGLADGDFEPRLPQVIEAMGSEVRENAARIHAELCPSVREMLEKLKAAGTLLGVVSGNLESVGWTKLEVAGLRPFFAFGCFSDRTELRYEIFRHGLEEVRHRLGPGARICIVGDTISDIQAAQKIGVPVIAVATGIYALDDLRALGPDLCVSCCTDLLQFIG